MTGLAAMAALAPALGRAQGGGHGHAHGGAEVRIGRHELGLEVRGGQATLSILDDREQPVDAAAFGATAIVLARGNERRTLEFRHAGGNRLAAPVDFAVDGRFRATVTLRGPGGDLGIGRFSIDPMR